MGYSVKEVVYTLQGEGVNAGRPAVFLRFAGCNLWTGRAADRELGPGSCSRWCDTDFVGVDGEGGGRFPGPAKLANQAARTWGERRGPRLIVCTGGEPLLQLDTPLVDELHARDFEVAIETNGTLPVPRGVDWVCVSPKLGGELKVRSGSELKVVYPQVGIDPKSFESLDFKHFLLQPLDGPDRDQNTGEALRFCLANPRWRLSLQTHKHLRIP